MIYLPGNTFGTTDGDYAESNQGRLITDATMALAYEQRTANLIAYMQLGVLAQERGVTFEDDIANEIMTRLGLTTQEPDDA